MFIDRADIATHRVNAIAGEVHRRVSIFKRARASHPFLLLAVRIHLLPIAALGGLLLASTLHAQPAPASYRETVLQIQQQIEQGHFDSAQTMIRAALERTPSDGGLENLLGIVDAEQGKTDLARQAFAAAIQHNPKLVGAYLNLGRIQMQQSGSDPASRVETLQLYLKVLRMDPANGEASYQAATLLMWDGQYAASLAHLAGFNAAVNGQIRVQALRCADEAGLRQAAAANRAAAAMAANPDLRERDAAFALPALRAARRADLIDTLYTAANLRAPLSADGLRVLGLAKEAEGKPAEATAVLERAYALDDTKLPPLVDLTRIALAGKDYKQALGYLAHARALKPGDAEFAYEYGRICMNLNLLGEARRAMTEAVKLDPESPEYNFALGVVSSYAQDASAGLPYLKKYHQMRPDDPQGVLALGTAYFRDDDYVNAVLWLRQAAKTAASAATAHYYLGRILRQQGQYDSALAELMQAETLQPDQSAVLAELGQTYVQMRDYPEAQKQLQQALALDANNYVANFALTQLYAQTRDPKLGAQQKRFGQIREKNQEQYREEMRVIEARPQVELKDN
jgi:tetratricopeptide (TPR) repeat protein